MPPRLRVCVGARARKKISCKCLVSWYLGPNELEIRRQYYCTAFYWSMKGAVSSFSLRSALMFRSNIVASVLSPPAFSESASRRALISSRVKSHPASILAVSSVITLISKSHAERVSLSKCDSR